MAPPSIRFLSADDVRKCLPMREAIELMKQAFGQLTAGQAVIPPRTHLDVAGHRNVVLFMPSYLPAVERIGLKLITLCSDNPARGLPRIQALVILLDSLTGTPLAILDGTTLTAIRTGAAAGAATDLLARPDAATVAVFGAGVQGRTQLEAVCQVRPLRQGWIFDPHRQAAEAFAAEVAPALGLPVRVAESPAQAVQEADVICTATTARTPVFDDRDLRPGTHINAIGSYQPSVQEIPAETVLRAQVVVDQRDAVLEEAGDLLIPLRQGRFAAEQLHAELGEIVLGTRPGRTSPEAITLFKSVGVALQDLAAGNHVLQRAERLGLGVAVPWNPTATRT